MPEASLSYEKVQLHLFLSIVVLVLLLRLLTSVPRGFESALFACMSTPATYALAYYHARVYRVGRFVRRKRLEESWAWVYEVAALVSSYAMGYLVYTAFSGTTDIVVFSLAFIVVQFMRLLTMRLAAVLAEMGVDIQHPTIVLLVAVSVAALALTILAITQLLLP